MFQLQLKRIDTAIAAGRLDEAFDLLISAPQREHREGQRVVDSLAEHLVRRAEQHLREQRPGDAKSDTHKAIRLAGRRPEIADLDERIAQAETERRTHQEAEREAARAAKIQAQLGHLTLGQDLLPSGPHHSRLSAEMERQRAIAVEAAGRLDHAIDSGDWQGSVAVLKSLDSEILRHRIVADKIRSAIDPIVKNASIELGNGRLDRVADILNLIGPLASGHAEFVELRNATEHCTRALHFIDLAQYSDADRELALAAQMVGASSWLSETRASLAELIRHSTAVRSGPLGLLQNRTVSADTNAYSPPRPSAPFVPSVHSRTSDPDEVANLLRVDGLGSILLLDSDVVSIGSFSNSKRYDIPIQTDGPPSPLYIRRAGEDYFAESESEFRLNDQPTKRRLLSSGDSISFGRRGRLKFRKPIPASSSAVMQLTGSGLARREIRHIALMSDSLLFCNSGGHFSISNCENPIVVFLGPNGYAIKYAGAGGEVHELNLGRSVLLGETRFTLNQINLS